MTASAPGLCPGSESFLQRAGGRECQLVPRYWAGLISGLTSPWGEGSPGASRLLILAEGVGRPLPAEGNDSGQEIIFNESNSPAGCEARAGSWGHRKGGLSGCGAGQRPVRGTHSRPSWCFGGKVAC